jgi:error-prone DNA polymerase
VAAARRQSQAPAPARAADELDVQLALDLGDAPGEVASSGLPEMTDAERVRAELEVLGLDASRHVVDFYLPLLDAIGVTPARDLLRRRNASEVLVAGVKVATQTPPVRSGRRVVFLTLDDSTGPVDATFFEDVQGPYAATVFGSWLLLVRGVVRRTGPRGISVRATGAWELGAVHDVWRRRGAAAVADLLAASPGPEEHRAVLADGDEAAVAGRAGSRSTRPVMAPLPAAAQGASYAGYSLGADPDAPRVGTGAGGMGQRGSSLAAAARAASAARAEAPEGETLEGETPEQRVRRVLVHASGFRQSPYADITPQGVAASDTRGQAAAAARGSGPDPAAGRTTDEQDLDDPRAPRPRGTRADRKPPGKLWHSSPGSSGW